MMRNITRQNKDSAIDAVNVLVGLALAASPWALGYHAVAAALWNALAIGAVVALISIGALAAFAEWEEWANFVLGIWLIVSPWALAFHGVATAAYVTVAAGVIVAVLAALELWFVHHRPLSTA
ncbi:MAG: SPW repeat protein [Roseiarcus sp.]